MEFGQIGVLEAAILVSQRRKDRCTVLTRIVTQPLQNVLLLLLLMVVVVVVLLLLPLAMADDLDYECQQMGY